MESGEALRRCAAIAFGSGLPTSPSFLPAAPSSPHSFRSSDRATKSALVNCVGKMVSLYFEGRALSEKLTATMLADLEEKVVAACAKIPAEVEAYKRDFELSGGSYAHSKPKNVPVWT